MTKRQIPVNGDKELIEKLNLNIKKIKSGEEPEIETKTEPVNDPKSETEPVIGNTPNGDETELIPTEVCELLETFEKYCTPKEDIINFNKVESDRQRNIKYRRDYRKTPENVVHAGAYPSVAEMNVPIEEVMEMIDVFGPKIAEQLSRINDAAEDNTLYDNEACRKTINKEHLVQKGETFGNPSDDFKKIINTSKELVKYLKGIEVDGIVGENIRDVMSKVKAKTVKEACECVASQHQYTEPEQREPETVETPKEENYEMVNHPAHYNNYNKEVIDIIERVWGTYLAAMWCEITAFKYRMRMGTKPTSSISEDLEKETWYLNKMRELKKKCKEGCGFSGI